MDARLVTIWNSHYCDKARWALDRLGVPYVEDAHAPIFHIPAVRRAGGRRTTPVLVIEGQVLPDSTDILRWLDAHADAPGALLGTTPEQAREVLDLEERFDEDLGPHTRRFAYFLVLPRKDVAMAALRGRVPWHEERLASALYPVARKVMERSMRIDRAGFERSIRRIDEELARVSDRLADGRRFLVGEGFTAADLAFAALSAPAVLPPEYPARLPQLSELPAEGRAHVERWRATPAGRHALRLYRDERRARLA
jgi:glutathione S-transferase